MWCLQYQPNWAHLILVTVSLSALSSVSLSDLHSQHSVAFVCCPWCITEESTQCFLAVKQKLLVCEASRRWEMVTAGSHAGLGSVWMMFKRQITFWMIALEIFWNHSLDMIKTVTWWHLFFFYSKLQLSQHIVTSNDFSGPLMAQNRYEKRNLMCVYFVLLGLCTFCFGQTFTSSLISIFTFFLVKCIFFFFRKHIKDEIKYAAARTSVQTTRCVCKIDLLSL